MSYLASKYGPWCVVAGASEGLGAAFAETIASRGIHLVLLARRAELLTTLADSLRTKHAIEVRTLACDLADASFVATLTDVVADLEIGLAVYNAAYSFVAPLFDRPVEDALRVIDVNVRGPVGPVGVERAGEGRHLSLDVRVADARDTGRHRQRREERAKAAGRPHLHAVAGHQRAPPATMYEPASVPVPSVVESCTTTPWSAISPPTGIADSKLK